MMTKIIDKDSKILDFKIKYYIKKPTKEEIKMLDIDDSEKYRIKYWAKIDGVYYYVKKARMLNEIIGELVAKELKLNTAQYIPINYFNELAFLTPNFKENNKEYHRLDFYFKKTNDDSLDNFKKILNKDNHEILKTQILKMYALDIYMRQLDRCLINILFEEHNNHIELAPLFDYSASFMCKSEFFNYYENEILGFDLKDIKDVYEKYPELREYLGLTGEIDTITLLKNKLEEYKLNFHIDLFNYYNNEFEESKKQVSKLIK